MFCYQDSKLYLFGEKELVGVNITPTGTSLTSEKAKYKNGMLMTNHEVKCAFGIYRGLSYTFPIKETVDPEKTTTTKK